MFNVLGRPPGSLRGSRSWFSLLAHTHLLVISDPFSSQFGVEENPRARELSLLLAVQRNILENVMSSLCSLLYSLAEIFLVGGGLKSSQSLRKVSLDARSYPYSHDS